MTTTAAAAEEEEVTAGAEEKTRPIPWKSVAVIGMGNASHFFGMCSLFSYAGLLCVDSGWAENTSSAGFAAGWLATSVFVGRLFTASPWGFFADRFGRRPALLLTLAAHAMGNLSFGLSRSFWSAVFSRVLFLGVMNGYTTLLGILTFEAAGAEHQNQVMAYVLGFGSVTQLMGPAIGGYLYRAIPRYPALASSIVGAGIAVVAFVITWLWLPETAPRFRGESEEVQEVQEEHTKKKKEMKKMKATSPSRGRRSTNPKYAPVNDKEAHDHLKEDAEQGYIEDACGEEKTELGEAEKAEKEDGEEGNRKRSVSSDREEETPQKEHSAWSMITTLPLLRRIVIMRTLVGLLFFSLVEIVPLWSITSPEVGGLGATEVDVGQLMTAAALVNIAFTVLVMGRCMRLLGQRASLLATGACAAAGFVLLSLVRGASRLPPQWDPMVCYVFTAGAFSLVHMALMAGTTASIGLTNTTAPPAQLGLANGIAVTVEGVGKGIAPAVTGSIFAASILRWGNAGHGLMFYLLAALSLVVAALALSLPASVEGAKDEEGAETYRPIDQSTRHGQLQQQQQQQESNPRAASTLAGVSYSSASEMSDGVHPPWKLNSAFGSMGADCEGAEGDGIEIVSVAQGADDAAIFLKAAVF